MTGNHSVARRVPVKVVGSCVDCTEGSTRPVTRPGPRCATHQRERKRLISARNHEKWILATYGITAAEYWAIFEAQGKKCYICGRATGRSKRLSVDHDHKTGQVRGLLCTPCNRDVLGHLRDDVNAFRRGIEYLTDPPARAVLERMRA